ncbi:hypothetical protein evm_013254 [Chilo suppressalis]|nr:hypothetical protein evm_013254 [Chilo suppressalis]
MHDFIKIRLLQLPHPVDLQSYSNPLDLILETIPGYFCLQELNGDGEVSRLMAVCARCVCDERAAVRRSSVSLLHRLLISAAAESGELRTSPSPNDVGQSKLLVWQSEQMTGLNTSLWIEDL